LHLSDFDRDFAAESLHPLGEYASGQIARFWALGLAAHGCVATRWNRTTIHPGLQAQLAVVQTGAPHAAQARQLSPSLRLALHTHNRTLYRVQLRILG